MKAIKTRPFQRQLLVVSSLAILTGCSGFQPAQVYKDLEQKVQYVYNAAAPIQQQGVVPALFKTVSVPGMDLLKNPMVLRANYRSYFQAPVARRPKPIKQNPKELRYIEQFYGL